jgi:hypothetical protein
MIINHEFGNGKPSARTVTTSASSVAGPGLRITKEEREAKRKEIISKQGQRAWSMLHRYKGCDSVFVEAWEAWIPSTCSCRDDYKAILKEHPFDFSSPDAFFRSGIELHNAVNRKLGKPELTLDEAYRIWRPNKE